MAARKSGRKRPQAGARPRRVDWKRARRLHEQDGKNFSEISDIVGCDRNTVARHAKREGWINGADLLRESSTERRENLLRSFIEQGAEAIRANLTRKHSLNERILMQAGKELARLEAGKHLEIGEGERIVSEDPLLALRRIALTVQTVEAVDRSIADLKGHDWRSGSDGGASDSDPDADAVVAVLAEVEGDAPRGRGKGAQGSV